MIEHAMLLPTVWILFRRETMHTPIQSSPSLYYFRTSAVKIRCEPECRCYGQRENHASKTELQPNDLGPFGNAIPSRGCEGTPVCVAQPPLGPLGVCGAAPLLLNAKRV